MGLGTQLASGQSSNLARYHLRRERHLSPVLGTGTLKKAGSCIRRPELSHTLRSHTVSKLMLIIGKSRNGGNNHLPEKLELSPLISSAPSDVDDVHLTQSGTFGLGIHFILKVSQVSMGCYRKYLSSSTLAHQKENLSFKTSKQNSQLSFFSPAHKRS